MRATPYLNYRKRVRWQPGGYYRLFYMLAAKSVHWDRFYPGKFDKS